MAKKGHYFLKPEPNHSTSLFQVKIYTLKSLTKTWMYKDSHTSLENQSLYTRTEFIERKQN